MRKTLTISMSEELLANVEHAVKTQKYSSTSEFIRRLIQNYFVEQEERKFLIKKRSNQLIKEAIERAKVDLD